MNIEKFTDMLLNSLEKMEVPAATVEQITEDGGLLGIETSDDSQFLIKIGLYHFCFPFSLSNPFHSPSCHHLHFPAHSLTCFLTYYPFFFDYYC